MLLLPFAQHRIVMRRFTGVKGCVELEFVGYKDRLMLIDVNNETTYEHLCESCTDQAVIASKVSVCQHSSEQ